jgi:hypothetical protein|tara:strand:+ start:957 stop:1316 length:360 start_codon:yes stop_codon:yes gene_type:complete
MEKKVGHYSFVIGVIIAVLLGLALPLGDVLTQWLTSILVVLGLVVGFLNVTGKETTEFLTVATILVIVAFAGGNAYQSLGAVQLVGTYIMGILNGILTFVVPATVVVALKDVIALSKIE